MSLVHTSELRFNLRVKSNRQIAVRLFYSFVLSIVSISKRAYLLLFPTYSLYHPYALYSYYHVTISTFLSTFQSFKLTTPPPSHKINYYVFPTHPSYPFDEDLFSILPSHFFPYLVRTLVTLFSPPPLPPDTPNPRCTLKIPGDLNLSHSFQFGRDGNFNKDYDRKNTVKVY